MDSQTKDLILLNMARDIGFIKLRALLERFVTTKGIFSAKESQLKQVQGIGPKTAESILQAAKGAGLEKELSLIEKHRTGIITIFDKEYPKNLKQIYDPPIVLYVKGRIKDSDELSVAFVGSRRASLYGLRTAERFSYEVASCGATVVSGMARGIDTASHKGALKAGGRTIAVLGSGLARIYPAENKRLSDEIAENGAVISEFSMEMPPHKNNFPQRNRVISGLSKAVVVVEAAKHSGALITADFALEQGRDVFAVPGSCDSFTSGGTNTLIKDGAKLIEDASDILEGLGIDDNIRQKNTPSASGPLEKKITDSLSKTKPLSIDEIIDNIGKDHKDLHQALLSLEMKGAIRQMPGRLYIRT